MTSLILPEIKRKLAENSHHTYWIKKHFDQIHVDGLDETTGYSANERLKAIEAMTEKEILIGKIWDSCE